MRKNPARTHMVHVNEDGTAILKHGNKILSRHATEADADTAYYAATGRTPQISSGLAYAGLIEAMGGPLARGDE